MTFLGRHNVSTNKMTIPANTAWGSAVGSSITGPYSIPFVMYDQTTLGVIEVANGVPSFPQLGTDYNFTSFVLDEKGQCASPQITFTNPVAAGTLIVFLLVMPGTQLTSITNFDQFFPSEHEVTFDQLLQMSLMLNQWAGKSIKAPDYEFAGQANLTLPSIAQRAMNFLFFDNLGNISLVAGVTNISTAITSYMANILAAVTDIKSFWNYLQLPNQDYLDPTSPAPSGTVNNYIPENITISGAGVLVMSPSGDLIMTGLIAPVTSPATLPSGYMQRLTLYNLSAHTITLKANDAGSSAINRFYMPSDVVIASNSAVDLVYTSRYANNSNGGWLVPVS